MYSSTRSSFACVGFRGYAGGFAAIDVIEDRDRASTGAEGDAISAMEDKQVHHHRVAWISLKSVGLACCCCWQCRCLSYNKQSIVWLGSQTEAEP